ncbi:DUF1292 domain-containing protein [Haloimpatiens lingqiaonensis]|uniref:DUF1292 domain-containing protein n=1 Tax=Haloimpatiens lingqiaonensis TaxID=1380675 RepID=UPI0010FEB8CD|nr:DUF1292 domain-containing protein [Haloimpatiens lingqiaonensis]
MDNNVEKITLKDEEGRDIEFTVITKLDIESDEYVIVSPSEDEEEEAIALKIQKDESGEEVLVTIDDEEEFARVAEAYELIFSDEEM